MRPISLETMTMRPHPRSIMPGSTACVTQICRTEVDGHDAIPVGGLELGGAGQRADPAGRVHHDVRCPEGVGRRSEDIGHRRLVGKVAESELRLPAGVDDRVDNAFSAFTGEQCRRRHGNPQRAQLERRRGADTGRGPGDES